jgi:hypothetical protein
MSFQAGVAVGIIVGLEVTVGVQAGVTVIDELGKRVGVDDAFDPNSSILFGVLNAHALIRNTPINAKCFVPEIFLWMFTISYLLFRLARSPNGLELRRRDSFFRRLS